MLLEMEMNSNKKEKKKAINLRHVLLRFVSFRFLVFFALENSNLKLIHIFLCSIYLVQMLIDDFFDYAGLLISELKKK